MCCATIRSSRAVCEQLMLWISQRKVFGKPLTSQAVIRHKMANLLSLCEAAQNWLENVTYQMTKMSYDQQAIHLAGQVALLKVRICSLQTFLDERLSREVSSESILTISLSLCSTISSPSSDSLGRQEFHNRSLTTVFKCSEDVVSPRVEWAVSSKR